MGSIPSSSCFTWARYVGCMLHAVCHPSLFVHAFVVVFFNAPLAFRGTRWWSNSSLRNHVTPRGKCLYGRGRSMAHGYECCTMSQVRKIFVDDQEIRLPVRFFHEVVFMGVRYRTLTQRSAYCRVMFSVRFSTDLTCSHDSLSFPCFICCIKDDVSAEHVVGKLLFVLIHRTCACTRSFSESVSSLTQIFSRKFLS